MGIKRVAHAVNVAICYTVGTLGAIMLMVFMICHEPNLYGLAACIVPAVGLWSLYFE